MPKLTFKNIDKSFEVEQGLSILQAALRHGVQLFHTCGGNCSCSTCHVIVKKGADNLSPQDALEIQVLDSFDLKPPIRLACQSLVFGDVEVEIPKHNKEPRPNKTPKVP